MKFHSVTVVFLYLLRPLLLVLNLMVASASLAMPGQELIEVVEGVATYQEDYEAVATFTMLQEGIMAQGTVIHLPVWTLPDGNFAVFPLGTPRLDRDNGTFSLADYTPYERPRPQHNSDMLTNPSTENTVSGSAIKQCHIQPDCLPRLQLDNTMCLCFQLNELIPDK